MKVFIGTRGSRLAIVQTDIIGKLLKKKQSIRFEKKIIKTTGDKITDVPLAKIGGKGIFVKELDDAVLDGRVDFAVHSMKFSCCSYKGRDKRCLDIRLPIERSSSWCGCGNLKPSKDCSDEKLSP
jgi:hypothetical protein